MHIYPELSMLPHFMLDSQVQEDIFSIYLLNVGLQDLSQLPLLQLYTSNYGVKLKKILRQVRPVARKWIVQHGTNSTTRIWSCSSST